MVLASFTELRNRREQQASLLVHLMTIPRNIDMAKLNQALMICSTTPQNNNRGHHRYVATTIYRIKKNMTYSPDISLVLRVSTNTEIENDTSWDFIPARTMTDDARSTVDGK